jgi:hypothetical protein
MSGLMMMEADDELQQEEQQQQQDEEDAAAAAAAELEVGGRPQRNKGKAKAGGKAGARGTEGGQTPLTCRDGTKNIRRLYVYPYTRSIRV